MDMLQEFRKRLAATPKKASADMEALLIDALEKIPEQKVFFADFFDALTPLDKKEAVVLLDFAAGAFTEKKLYAQAVAMFIRLSELDPKNVSLRGAVADCLKHAHDGNPHVLNLITLSRFEDMSVPLARAFEQFERFMMFNKGGLVRHGTYGTGAITDISYMTGSVSINFPSKGLHRMDLQLAVKALQKIDDSTIDGVVAARSEELKNMKDARPADVVLMILRYVKKAPLDELERCLKGSVVPEAGWKKWMEEAAAGLACAKNVIVTGKTASRCYELVDDMGGLFTASFDSFLTMPDMSKAADAMKDLVRHCAGQEGVGTAAVDEALSRLKSKIASLKEPVRKAFAVWALVKARQAFKSSCEITQEIEFFKETAHSAAQWLKEIGSQQLQKELLGLIKDTVDEWEPIYSGLLGASHKIPFGFCMEALYAAGRLNEIRGTLSGLFASDPSGHSNATLWIVKNLWDEGWEEVCGPLRTKDTVKTLYELAGRLKDEAESMDENLRDVCKELKKRAWFKACVSRLDKKDVIELVRSVMELPWDLMDKKSLVIDAVNAYPETKTLIEKQDEKKKEEVFYTSIEKLREKQKELETLMSVTIPENSRDIARAREHGDLRENAEYKAAKEMQGILMRRAADLRSELGNVAVINPAAASVERAGIGTTVTLAGGGKRLTYTILGIWDSDQNKGILSYKQPLAAAIIGSKAGDTVKLSEAGLDGSFTVEKIERYDNKI